VAGATIETTTPAGKLGFGLLGDLARSERELIIEHARASRN
jgi:DNA invertase Pin-like site-specific DNA recombinase